MGSEASCALLVVELLEHAAAQVDIDVAYIPLSIYARVEAVCHLHTQLHASRYCHGVGKVGDIGGLEKVVAVVSEQAAQSGAFLVEGSYVEGCIAFQQSVTDGGLHEAVGGAWEIEVGYRVEGEEVAHVHIIAYALFLWFLRGYDAVFHLTTQVAVSLQCRLCHSGSQLRVYAADGYWCLAECVVEPLAHSGLRVGKGIPHPQGVGERCAVVAAAKQCTVGLALQYRLHLFLGEGRLVVGLIVVEADMVETDV